MTNSIKGVYNSYQLDSVCNIERIPYDLEQWHNNFFYDYETNEKINQYIFVKNQDVIYTITVDDSIYYFTKRIVQKIQK